MFPDDLLPEGSEFDPELCLPRVHIDGQPFHTTWMAAEYAARLMTRSGAEGQAAAVMDALEGSQDRDPGSPDFGNFRWEREDRIVEDLNAAPFVSIRLAPALLRHGAALAPRALERACHMIRLCLEAIVRIDVASDYTNIVAQSVASLRIGGALLGDARFLDIGATRFRRWMEMVDRAGLAHEYNSPVYTEMTVASLSQMVDLDPDPELRFAADQFRMRQVLGFALRIHPETDRLAPPYCRAYAPFMFARTASERTVVEGWIEKGWAPEWISAALECTGEVRETSDGRTGLHLTSRLDAGLSMGTASAELATQNNRFIAAQSMPFGVHLSRGADRPPTVVFSRYILNDQWLGSYRTTGSRPVDQVFFDHGAFIGAQDGNRVFCLYRPRTLDAWERTWSAKACLIVSDEGEVSEILADGSQVSELPADLPPGSCVELIVSGRRLTLQPLNGLELQPDAPVRVQSRDGMLVVECHDYLGPPRTFWTQAKPGSFFQGYIRSGFHVTLQDAAERARPVISQSLDDFRGADGQRVWSLNDDAGLGLDVDLMGWTLEGERIASGDPAPMLASSVAVQSRSGRLTCNGATLTCGPVPATLLAWPERNLWVASVHAFDVPDAITLSNGRGEVRLPNARGCVVVWSGDRVRVEATGLEGEIAVTGAELEG
ncbi:hypothetical protein R5H30_18285 [Sulfitobacter sp. D35]|uniref:hypothetical protein n=1 Tax=Sulfitobacter sp. D35 TaxID=3083252 RepID=UPI00296E3A5C|nr:hypothetical protein [Sulfitobacter sp. D35]MDW4499947.1 hypothetical protein [Sulfitobacter sp. D35]